MICNLIKILYESHIGEEKFRYILFILLTRFIIIINDFNIAKEIYKMKRIYIQIPRRVCLAQ